MTEIVRKASWLFCFFILLGSTAFAGDKTYTCSAVDRQASLGVSDRSAVSVTTGNKTCSFSVDGSAVDGNARRQFLNAMNSLFGGGFDNSNPEAFKNLLLAIPLARSQGSLHDFDNQFRSASSDLSDCIAGFRNGSSRSFDNQGISCETIDSSGSVGGFPVSVEWEGRGRVLVIGVELSSGYDRGQGALLFIPEELMLQGMLGFRYSVQ
ncbi:hypothetical protein ACC697_04010 [Rhizobium ruizarguesonis]